MNTRINKLIPKAIEAISYSQSKMANADGKVEKEYKGYISSMGASILQSGLIATLAFYSKDAESSGAKRTYLLDAIKRIITDDPNNNEKLLYFVLVNSRQNNNNGNDVRVADLNQTKLKEFEHKISDALIALKLALRTYEQKK